MNPPSDKQKTLTGVLISNLGTPDAPTPPALRKYLAEFLSDTRVIEKPRWLWQIILHGIILNIRPRKAARAYQSVWTDNGSPLMHHSLQQLAALQQSLQNDQVVVELAMRYGSPSIEQGLQRLMQQGVGRILVLPLYPQYSASTTASTYDAVFNTIRRTRNVPEIHLLGAYYQHELYIQALANSVREHWNQHGQAEKLMMSFHGLPKRYVDAGDPYQQQCLDTAQALAQALQLQDSQWQCTFQSRFGPEQWLQPYTDKTLEAWAKAGIGSVDVICPGFSADCLETIEEIGAQNRELFIENGGERFHYIPCLNDRDDHIALLARLIQSRLPSAV